MVDGTTLVLGGNGKTGMRGSCMKSRDHRGREARAGSAAARLRRYVKDIAATGVWSAMKTAV